MVPILLDTSILIYFIDPRDKGRQEQAIEVLTRLGDNDSGHLSVQNLAEFMNASYKLADHVQLQEVVNQVNRWVNTYTVFDLTSMVIFEAIRGVRVHKLAYYDAQIWATARLNQVPVIFSEDFQDGQILDGVRIVNPFSDHFDITEWQ
jgi:predicted nucleic acid-binding protein